EIMLDDALAAQSLNRQSCDRMKAQREAHPANGGSPTAGAVATSHRVLGLQVGFRFEDTPLRGGGTFFPMKTRLFPRALPAPFRLAHVIIPASYALLQRRTCKQALPQDQNASLNGRRSISCVQAERGWRWMCQ